MSEYEHYRRRVEQKVFLIQAQGGWEGAHLDLKLELEDRDRTIAKLIKHILAFANTPRKDDAFIIFGVRENKKQQRCFHEGATKFPSAEKIYSIIETHSTLERRDFLIDDQFEIENKRTPYIVIRQVYDGPYWMTKNLNSSPKTIK